MFVRPLNPDDPDEISLVATRMRLTLQEVIDPETGAEMYTLDWLRDRIHFHLDRERSHGQVFVAVVDGTVVGHTIVRAEPTLGTDLGLFSTTYVAPEARRMGTADRLLATGEAWMQDAGLVRAVTQTAKGNHKLIALYEKRGYRIGWEEGGMIRLGRALG